MGRHHLMAGATGRFTRLGAGAAPIDPATGRPGAGRTFPRVSGRSNLHPLDWPLGPGGFLAAAASLGDRFTLGVATYTPFAQRVALRSAPDGEQPNRYHAVSTDLRNLALVPALSIRLGGGLRIGAAPGFLFSVGRLVVDEDTALGGGTCGLEPCGAENPEAAARYDVSSDMGLFDSSLAFTLGFGVHLLRGRWSMGLSYLTRPLGTTDGTEVNGRRTQVTPPPRAGGGQLVPARGDRLVRVGSRGLSPARHRDGGRRFPDRRPIQHRDHPALAGPVPARRHPLARGRPGQRLAARAGAGAGVDPVPGAAAT